MVPTGLPNGILADFADGPLPTQPLTIGETAVNIHYLGDRKEFASQLSFILDEAVSDERGAEMKVLDLWNTWCGPCRMAIRQNEPLKDGELSSEDIVLYMADESSDHFPYLEMIPNIKGLHNKLSGEQIEKISERFNVDDIPYYILVDREGNAKGRPELRDHSKYVKEIKGLL